MNKRNIGGFLFIISICFFVISFNPNLTGYVVSSNTGNISYLNILAVTLLVGSVYLMTSRITLDTILVPGNKNEEISRQRARRAIEEKKYSPDAIIVASGGDTQGPKSKYISEAHIIYEELRKAGIKPSEMRMEGKSKDTVENVLYSIGKAKGSKIGVVSYPGHIERVRRIVEEAKKKGIVPKGIEIYGVGTKTRWFDKVYELFARPVTEYLINKKIKKK